MLDEWEMPLYPCKGHSTWDPQALGTKSLEFNPYNLNHWERGSWDLPLHTRFQVLSPKYDMDAYMATLSEGEAWDLCRELGREKNHTQLSTQARAYICIKEARSNLDDR